MLQKLFDDQSVIGGIVADNDGGNIQQIDRICKRAGNIGTKFLQNGNSQCIVPVSGAYDFIPGRQRGGMQDRIRIK